jgi:ribosomal-protein-alanine N-acetyltransferase
MRGEDVSQVTEIDHEAFHDDSLFPFYAQYQRELRNPLARYVVASLQRRSLEPERLTWLKRIFNHGEGHAPDKEYIVGFAGLWTTLKEAHLSAIAVRSAYQSNGIGERLLIAVIELAMQLNARIVTLEVRVSNEIAQALYKKYGFQVVGRHPRYYSNDGEDALIMTTDSITSASFQARFQNLKRGYNQRQWFFTSASLA